MHLETTQFYTEPILLVKVTFRIYGTILVKIES